MTYLFEPCIRIGFRDDREDLNLFALDVIKDPKVMFKLYRSKDMGPNRGFSLREEISAIPVHHPFGASLPILSPEMMVGEIHIGVPVIGGDVVFAGTDAIADGALDQVVEAGLGISVTARPSVPSSR